MTAADSTLELLDQGDAFVLKIRGVFDETVKLRKVLTELAPSFGTPKKLLIDFQGVVRINSLGLREWILFLEQLQGKLSFEISRLSEVIIMQAAVAPGVLGPRATPIHELEIPYYCESCKKRHTRYYPTDLLRGGESLQAPPEKCPECGEEMDFDALESEYLRVLVRK